MPEILDRLPDHQNGTQGLMQSAKAKVVRAATKVFKVFTEITAPSHARLPDRPVTAQESLALVRKALAQRRVRLDLECGAHTALLEAPGAAAPEAPDVAGLTGQEPAGLKTQNPTGLMAEDAAASNGSSPAGPTGQLPPWLQLVTTACHVPAGSTTPSSDGGAELALERTDSKSDASSDISGEDFWAAFEGVNERDLEE